MTLDDVKRLHPTALEVRQIKNNQLFLIGYPGLELAVSYQTLIAFKCLGEWHISTEKNSKTTTKHQYHLLDLIRVKRWYKTRKEFLTEFSSVLDYLTIKNS
jgi:hypothetical protein